ncbi:MAG: EAL domain-containing protein [Clostridia bacterium]
MQKRNVRIITIALSIIMCCTLILPSSVYAMPTQNKVVNIGWMNIKGYMGGTVDQPSGYFHEYLEIISQYTRWKYKYVICENFYELSQKLFAGEIDIMCGVFDTKARKDEGKFAFPQYSAGVDSTSIFVHNESDLLFGNPADLEGLTIGVEDNANYDNLVEYYESLGLDTSKIIKYTSMDDIKNDILRGKIPLGAMGGFRNDKCFRAIATFAPSNFYFVTSFDPKHKEILHGLNDALEQINIHKPSLHNSLASEYLVSDDAEFHLTYELDKYVKTAKPFTVLCNSNAIPIEFKGDNGELCGVTADYFKELSQLTGLKFDFIFEQGNIKPDIIPHFNYSIKQANELGYNLSNLYMRLPMVLIKNKNHGLGERTAVPDYYLSNYDPARINGIGKTIIHCQGTLDCLDAVVNNRADQTIVNSVIASRLVSGGNYRELIVTTLNNEYYNYCIAVSDSIDTQALDTINMAINHIKSGQVSDMLVSNAVKYQDNSIFAILNRISPVTTAIIITVSLVSALTIILLLISKLKNNILKVKNLGSDNLTSALSRQGFIVQAREILNTIEGDYDMIDFDIENFGYINELYGITIGDAVLKKVVDDIKSILEPNEIISRLYADHFLLLLNDLNVNKLMQVLDNSLENFIVLNESYAVNFKFGIYKITDKTLAISYMASYANSAKSGIKHNALENSRIYDVDRHNMRLRRVRIVAEFDFALKSGEIFANFQPKFDAITKRVVGAEALARWRRNGEFISPLEFIDLIEKNGKVIELDFFILRQTCQLLRQLADEGKQLLPISVNFSRLHINNVNFVRDIEAVLCEYGIDRKYIEIEFTESIMIEDRSNALTTGDLLNDAGFTICIDDFGSGYSSLNALKDLKYHIVKLDAGFFILKDTSNLAKAKTILVEIIKLLKAIGAKIVAEGIETNDQYEFARDAGCDYIQGYYFSKAISKEETLKLFRGSDE